MQSIEFENITIQEILKNWIWLSLSQVIGYYQGSIKITLGNDGLTEISFHCTYVDVMDKGRVKSVIIKEPVNTENLYQLIENRFRRIHSVMACQNTLPSSPKWVIE